MLYLLLYVLLDKLNTKFIINYEKHRGVNMDSIGKRIRKIRKENNLSQKQLAKKLSVSQATVGHYEKNKRNPSIDNLIKLADIGNVSLDWLITGKKGNIKINNMVSEKKSNYKTSEYKTLIEILENDKKLKELIFNLVTDLKKTKSDLKNIKNYLYNNDKQIKTEE